MGGKMNRKMGKEYEQIRMVETIGKKTLHFINAFKSANHNNLTPFLPIIKSCKFDKTQFGKGIRELTLLMKM